MNPLPPDDDPLIARLRRAMRDEEPPPPLVKAAVDLWPKRPAMRDKLAGMASVLATLVRDSWTQSPAALGLRGTGGERRTRHLLFSAEGRDLDLRISADATASPKSWTIDGQVLGPDSDGEVVASREGGEERSVPLDAMGEFSMRGLPAGRYVVTFVCEATRIVLPDIEIGAPP